MVAGMDRVDLRPLAPADTAELRRIRATPEVFRWWGELEDDFPEADEPEVRRYTVLVDGAVAGMVQTAEDEEPRYRHAGIDVFLDPAVHGRGIGTEVLRRVVDHLFRERGHHRITIDPAASNAAAIRAYAKVGFKPVGIMRDYERDAGGDAWHDGLLMELLARDADQRPSVRTSSRAFPRR